MNLIQIIEALLECKQLDGYLMETFRCSSMTPRVHDTGLQP